MKNYITHLEENHLGQWKKVVEYAEEVFSIGEGSDAGPDIKNLQASLVQLAILIVDAGLGCYLTWCKSMC